MRDGKEYTAPWKEVAFIELLLILIVSFVLYQSFHVNRSLKTDYENIRTEIGILNSNAELDRAQVSICRSMAAKLWYDVYPGTQNPLRERGEKHEEGARILVIRRADDR